MGTTTGKPGELTPKLPIHAWTTFKGGCIVYDTTINPSGEGGPNPRTLSYFPLCSSIVRSLVRSFVNFIKRIEITKHKGINTQSSPVSIKLTNMLSLTHR